MRIHMRLFRRKLKSGKLGNYYVDFDGGERSSLKTGDKIQSQRIYRKLRRK